jgi:hypothetical protein
VYACRKFAQKQFALKKIYGHTSLIPSWIAPEAAQTTYLHLGDVDHAF